MKNRIHNLILSKVLTRVSYFWILIGVSALNIKAQTTTDSLIYRVLLTANTADITQNSTFYKSLSSHLAKSTEPFVCLLLGDLLANNLSPFISKTDSLKINFLLKASSAQATGRTIIIPGDRDWNNSGKDGLKQVKRLENVVKSFNPEKVKWAIDKGCPGPKVFALGENILLVTINTQWWNHPYAKPGPADADCSLATEEDFLEELEDILDENEDKNIILAGHLPLVSLGESGGHLPLKKHFLPVPVVGSFRAAYRQNIGTSRDIHNQRFNPFRHKLLAVLANRNNLIYLSGHEANLQIIPENTNYFINSGSPTQAGFAAKGGKNSFSEAIPGLIELQYYQSGKVEAQVLASTEAGFQVLTTRSLYQPATQEPSSSVPVNYVTANRSSEKTNLPPESAPFPHWTAASGLVIAGPEYKAGSLKTAFWGKHYRDTWTASVRVPYLNLDTTFGGLQVDKRGGGRQTKSLKFKTPTGQEYVFRSVNKDPSKALKYELRETIAARVLRDQTTTQHPYGAMAADVLLNELDILHAHPKLYILPDNPKLGPFRPDFENLLGMLEEKPAVPKKSEAGFAGAQKIVKTNKLFRELYDNPRVKVDKAAFARARVFDILVGDWGKHEDNWKWAGYKQEKGMLYKPIPRDRDHVFSRWDGFIPWLADREWAKPSGENFDYAIKDIRSLTWQARHLDRFVASELDKNDWLTAAKIIQTKLSDPIIDKAVGNMPAEIQPISGQQISQKLKTRIKYLDTYTQNYYKLLAKYVDVVGSNKEEYFQVNRKSNGTVEVLVYEKGPKEEPNKDKAPLYHRRFYPTETKEIRLYGLKGKDVFDITGESKKSIKLRVIGGPGSDSINDQSRVQAGGKRTFIYEQNAKSAVNGGVEGKRITTWNQSVYNYDRTAFAYNTYFPTPYLSYNQYNGIELGIGVLFTRQKFGKTNYSAKHHFRVSGTTQGNLVFNYSGRFHQVIKKWDVELEGIYARPDNYNFFFGLGNETSKNQALFDKDYYLTQYNLYGVGTSFIRDFWQRSNFAVKVAYQRYRGVIESNTILAEQPDFFGISPLHFLEGEAKLNLDFRDNPFLPNKGMRFWAAHQNGLITNYQNRNYGITSTFIEYYATVNTKFPLTLGLKAGGGDTYGPLPFYKQLSLGQLNDLRGYVRYRFTGDSKLYFNSELRVQLLDIKTAIVPIKLGVKGFYDRGRVYREEEHSKKWHEGYGGGMYVVPLNERFTCSASVAFSQEESAFLLVSIGKAFR